MSILITQINANREDQQSSSSYTKDTTTLQLTSPTSSFEDATGDDASSSTNRNYNRKHSQQRDNPNDFQTSHSDAKSSPGVPTSHSETFTSYDIMEAASSDNAEEASGYGTQS